MLDKFEYNFTKHTLLLAGCIEQTNKQTNKQTNYKQTNYNVLTRAPGTRKRSCIGDWSAISYKLLSHSSCNWPLKNGLFCVQQEWRPSCRSSSMMPPQVSTLFLLFGWLISLKQYAATQDQVNAIG
jgi:hypothetical protein